MATLLSSALEETKTTGVPGVLGAMEGALEHKGTLLIVDDEEGPRLSLRLVFKDEYNLLMAASGAEAIELAGRNKVDVALLDIRMAGMSGIDLLERLKFVDSRMQVVMMTAFETTDTMRQALRLRACDYLNKPFDVATMRAAVSGAMQRRALEGEADNTAGQFQHLAAELQNQKIEELRAKTRSDVFASILHDFNGPLTVISGFAQSLLQRIANADRLEGADVEFIRERLKTITRQVTNCVEIQKRYIMLLQKGKEGVVPRVSLSQVFVDLNHLLRVHPSRHENEFSIRPPAEDVHVRMNGTDVIQMLLNLAVNAFQCSSLPHSVSIGGEALPQVLDLNAFKDGPHDRFLNMENFENHGPLIRLTVQDTGPGIPQEVLPKIFEPYFTTKAPRQGTGLGLNIVLRLLKEANGALHVHSVPGEGTRFDIYLNGAPLTA